MTAVLLLGGTGAVGRGCLDALRRTADVTVTLAGRDEQRLAALADPATTVVHADLRAPDRIADLAAEADVVINCAGPSHRYSAAVAGAVIAAGAAYVDPGGDDALLERLRAQAPTAPVVLQAGVQPGISGLALRAIAERLDGEVDEFTVWCGGLQPLTAAAIEEYLASLRGDTGTGTVLRGSRRMRVPANSMPRPPAPHFPESAVAHIHLDEETAAVAAALGVSEVSWANVSDGSHTTSAIGRLHAETGDQPLTSDRLAATLAAARLDLFGRAPYFTLVARAEGPSGAASSTFTCTDSYAASGAVAAVAALNTAATPIGVHPLWALEPMPLFAALAAAVPGLRIDIGTDAETAVEQGAL
ncbi:saccharopine dehydrogenase NADP-binding domain-containing protein [Nocardia cyriacigeorgica]|uniref:saccharopine dehydrogenase NADP-binding domain-containing protein n=1 Tax=Nocardia cyriacigeorgica TaxID=135487 RepID=UPI002456FF38|nr:saccharopine dehydrogenase NADP-binding domain-containing protein [Nocardia cyriacigeorgica]